MTEKPTHPVSTKSRCPSDQFETRSANLHRLTNLFLELLNASVTSFANVSSDMNLAATTARLFATFIAILCASGFLADSVKPAV